MRVMLPGESDPAVHLNIILSQPEECLGAEVGGGGRRYRAGFLVACGDVTGCHIHCGHSQLKPDEPVSEPVLDSLKRADRAPKLRSLPGVSGGHLKAPPSAAQGLRG